MIYKAFLNRQEITGFPVKGKETSEIWGGDTLLWKKSGVQDYFKFEYEGTIIFGIKGTNISIDWGDGKKETFSNEYENAKLNDKDNYITHIPISDGRHITEIYGTNLEVQFGYDWISTTFGALALTKVLSPLPRSSSKLLAFKFYECENLESVPEDLFKNCGDATGALQTFMDTPKLKTISEKLFDYTPKLQTATWTFRESGIETIPGKLFSKCEELNGATSCFQDCTGLKTAGDGFLSKQKMIVMHGIFTGCSSLTKVGEDFFKNADPLSSENAWGFNSVFYGCTELTQAPNLYAKFPTLTDTQRTGRCYYKCEKLPFYSSLPDRWK